MNKYTALDKQFNSVKALMKDITEYLLPEMGNYLEKGKPYEASNVERFDNILNDAGTRANQILGAGMMGGLCSPSRRWFRLTLGDRDLADFGPVKEWLHYCEKVLYSIYAGSNFYTEVHGVFEAQGGFGTAVLLQEESVSNTVRFKSFEIGEYRLAAGPNDNIDTCYRMFWMTVKQMIEMFGNNVSNSVKSAYENNKTPYDYHEVLHVL